MGSFRNNGSSPEKKTPSLLLLFPLVILLLNSPYLDAKSKGKSFKPGPVDLSKGKHLYVVVNSHLDTQWNWSIQETIAKFIPNTVRDNIKLLEKYPYYQFNWEGAIRYMMLKEYYPDLFEDMKKYIKSGRWNVAGNVVVSLEMNTVSPESHIRQILYGRNYFKKEFNRTSCDLLMPDTSGFPYYLPTIASHCGLEGFSSMKLGLKLGARTAQPIPFDIGM